MVGISWQILSAKIQGTLHIKQNKPCQDAICYHHFMPHGLVCAVADGHGSMLCPYSEEGARLATRCAVKLMQDMAYYNDAKELYTLMGQLGSVTLPQQLEKKWKDEVLFFHETQNRIASKEGLKDKEKEAIYKQYGTTLMVLVITSEFVYAAQIGDGDMLCVDQEGSVQYVIEQTVTYGVETHSLCERKAWRHFKTICFPITEDFNGQLFLMSTDGYANSFISSHDFLQVGKDYLELLKEQDLETVEKMLPIWLNEASENGSGDDMTLALIHRRR